MNAVLPHTFEELFTRHAARLAITDPDGALSYSELGDHARAAARRITEFAGPDTSGRLRVALCAANSTEYVAHYIGVLLAGGVPFLIDAAFGPYELARIAEDCSLDLLIHASDADMSSVVDETLLDEGEFGGLSVSRVRRFSPERPELLADTEVCRFTSGSTGKPNCIEFSGAAVRSAAENWAAGSGLSADDRIVCLAALSNGLSFNTSLLAAFLPGATLHLSRGLPTASRIVRLLESTGATRLVAFPALYESIVRRPSLGGFTGVTTAISSGAPLREATRKAFTALTGVPIHNYYGVAEAGPLTFASDGDGPGLGTALPGVHLLADEAGIRVRSESMGSRYLNAPGVFEARVDAHGYYRTGDVGHLVSGALHLTGRTGLMVNVGGRKVDPVEVADVIREAAGVSGAVVFEADNQHGEASLAAVVACDGATVQTLRAHCASVLPSFKVPGIFHLVDRIPVNSIGKPSVEQLRRLLAEAQAN